MATINAGNLTLLDHAKRMDPKGGIAPIVELLTTRNTILPDAVFKEGNLPTGHRVVSRTALPSLGWRRLNEGITAGKSRTDQIDEACGILAGKSVVDRDVARLNGNEMAFRFSEDRAFLQAFNKEMETGLFYHSTASNPERFNGLTGRLTSTSGTYGAQIIKADATAAGSDQTSMWIVGWGDETVYCMYPKGSPAGLESTDLGLIEQEDAAGSGSKFLAYATYWQWKIGLCVQDARYLVRIANVDTSAISATGSTLIQALVRGVNQMQDLTSCRPVIYCNRTVGTYLQLQAMDTTKNSTLTIQNVGGVPVTTFMGIPVKQTDALVNTEAVVS